MRTVFCAFLITLLWASPSAAAPPANNFFSNAQAIAGTTVSVSGTTVEATGGNIANDVSLDGNVSSAPSVFYRWTVPTGVTNASITVTFNDSTPGECIATTANELAHEPKGGLAQYRTLPGVPDGRTFVISTFTGEVVNLRVAEAPAVATGGTFTLSIAVNQVRTVPVNDRYTGAIQLPGTSSASATGTLSGATSDGTEYYYDSEDSFKTKIQAAAVWYRWTCPPGATTFWGVSVTGPAPAEVTIYGENDPQTTYGNSNGTGNRFLFGAGTSIYLKVSAYLGTEALSATGGAFTVNIARSPNLDSPQQTNTGLSYDLRGATGSTTDPGSSRGAQDVYVSLYSAPGVSTLTGGVWELGSIVPKGLSLTIFRRVNPSPVYAVISHAQNSTSTRFTALPGQEYIARIAVESRHLTTTADLQGTLILTPPAASGAPPANDLFANAVSLSDSALSITVGNTAKASGEVSEAFSERSEVVTNDIPNRTLWYRLVPTQGSGPVFFYALDDDNKPLHVRVTTGGLGFFGNEGADAELTDSGVLVSNGTPYYISVDEGAAPAHGSFRLFVGRTVFFDSFADAPSILPFSGAAASYTSMNFGATLEPSEPSSGGGSLWYKFFAPNTNRIYMNTFGSTYDTIVHVYTGTTVGALTLIATNDDFSLPRNTSSALDFVPVANTLYYLRLSGFSVQRGIATLRIGSQVSAWNPYVLWSQNWPAFSDGPLMDRDGDGLKNIEELAYGGNPLVKEITRDSPASSPVRYFRTGTNPCGIIYTSVAQNLIGQGIGQPITVIAQSSPDLANWSPLATVASGGALVATIPTTAGKGYVRARVTNPN